MNDQTNFAVMALWIYPTKDQPGISLATVQVETEGLAGDRRKKSPLHLVAAADAAELTPRANLGRHGRTARRACRARDDVG